MSWNIEDSKQTYRIASWGLDYFDINASGNISISPFKNKERSIDIMTVIKDVAARGLACPIMFRFHDILRSRVQELNESFRKSMTEYGYKGRYTGVFPIKVNQLREVVEEILEAGEPYGYGVECGSKSELQIALALVSNPETLIVANGYKDSSFIRMAMLSRKVDKNTIIVIEKLSELHEVIRLAKELKVQPSLGFRVKLSARGQGKWKESTGDQSKFGLSAVELMQAIGVLRKNDMTQSFNLLHFHMGSQIPDIQAIKLAAHEAARVYVNAHEMGMALKYIDVGGGLGVDYDGSRTTFPSSMNYTMQEYANDVVYAIQDVCDSAGVPHPNIVSESGRAVVSPHSVLVLEVFGKIDKTNPANDLKLNGKSETDLVREMVDVRQQVGKKDANMLEGYHDAQHIRGESDTLFRLGYLNLESKAKIEQLYWQTLNTIHKSVRNSEIVPEELQELDTVLAQQYLCNFSIFQSLLDHWAIEHLFPIMPLHRLDEQPQIKATLADITCDSDGQINKFIDFDDVAHTLALHTLNEKPYYLGIFLVGAYQDIMGDSHNLFGRVNEVHIFVDDNEPDNYYVEEIINGTKVHEVLSYVQYSGAELLKMFRKSVQTCIKSGSLKPREGMNILDSYESSLKEYTYLHF